MVDSSLRAMISGRDFTDLCHWSVIGWWIVVTGNASYHGYGDCYFVSITGRMDDFRPLAETSSSLENNGFPGDGDELSAINDPSGGHWNPPAATNFHFFHKPRFVMWSWITNIHCVRFDRLVPVGLVRLPEWFQLDSGAVKRCLSFGLFSKSIDVQIHNFLSCVRTILISSMF